MTAIDHLGREPVYLQLAGILRAGIVDGTYQPGRRVPSEPELVAAHGVARDTARKALRVLRDEGLVEVVRGRGTFVVEAAA
jgi:GntR family transcriptional regulator